VSICVCLCVFQCPSANVINVSFRATICQWAYDLTACLQVYLRSFRASCTQFRSLSHSQTHAEAKACGALSRRPAPFLAFALQFIIIIVIVVVVVVVLDIASFSVRLGSQEHVTTSDIVTHVCERQWCVSVVERTAAACLSPAPPRLEDTRAQKRPLLGEIRPLF